MVEDEVLQRFDALDLPLRNPSGFLHVVHTLYPEDVEGLPARARSWAAAESAVYSLRLPSSVERHGGDLERKTDLSICLISTIGMIKARKPKYDQSASDKVSLCRYCWRLGLNFGDRRGYADRSIKVTHAYCGLHEPRAESIISGTKGLEAKIYRRVINQKQIQKARKVAKLADRIERWVVQRDTRLSRRHGASRSWVVGLFIAERKGILWPQFVSLFFPYVYHSAEWKGACLSPFEAFSTLERNNAFEGREEFHGKVREDAQLLASLIMPMMLRLDVSIEVELMIANRRRIEKRTGYTRHSWPDPLML